MRTREEQREDRRQYEGDVVYEVWRNGGNPDAVNMDLLEDRYYEGVPANDAAASEIRRQRPLPSHFDECEELCCPDDREMADALEGGE